MSNQPGQSIVLASLAEKSQIDSLPTDQVRCLSKGNDNTNYATLTTVTQNGHISNKIKRTFWKYPQRKQGLKKK